MASAIVGALRVILQADTAEFKSGLDAAGKGVTDFAAKLGISSGQLAAFGKVFGTALSIEGVRRAAGAVLDYASSIKDLSDQTGLSMKTIQEMGHAAKLTGSSVEAFANAAFKLGTNLSGGSNSVIAAVERLGLSYAQLRDLSPDEQFNLIATALGKVENAQDRNKLAVDLFGKAAKEILPAIAQGYDDIASSAIVAGDAQIHALDEAGDALDSFIEGLKRTGVQAAGSVLSAVSNFDELDKSVQKNTISTWDWASALEAAGMKAQTLPKIMRDLGNGVVTVATTAGNLPKPLEAINLSVREQELRMKALEVQHKRVSVSTKEVGQEQEEIDENIQRLTRSLESQIEAFRRTNTIAASVHESFRLMRVDFTETIPVLQNLSTHGFEPFKASLQASGTAIRTWADTAKEIFGGVPQAIVNAIQGGGSIISAAGASIGVSLMSKFQATFGPAIKAALPFGIGEAINALLPTLGALFGPVAKKIGDFFRNIFGGPSAEEMRGRQAVAEFESDLHDLLTETQRAEAGNEAWKMTVIAIRDAYLAAGRTEEEALRAAERLWQSSKKGAAETAAAIAAIQAVLDQTAGAADDAGDALDYALRDRTVRIEFDTPDVPENHGYGEGFASGTMGQLGKWFGDFGSGMRTTLHGMEAVVTPQQAPAFAMDVLSKLGSQESQPAQALQRPIVIQNATENRIIIDGNEMKRWILESVTTAIENNERGIRSRQRDALGVTT